MQPDLLKSELFTKDHTFVGAVPLFREAVDKLAGLPAAEAGELCDKLLGRMDQIYNDDILLRSYNGYVTFPTARAYSAFLDATRAACAAYELLAERGLQPLRCRKAAVYLRVMGMSAATRDFKYGLLENDRKTWDDEIFDLEEKILEQEPNYTVPSSELPQNQRDLIANYWLRHPEEYWLRHSRLERIRNRSDSYKKIVNSLGIAMLVIPLLFLLICLFTGAVQTELTLMVVFAFVLIGLGVYLFGYLRRRSLRAIKEFELQGVGQLNRVIPPVAPEPQTKL